LQCSPRVSVVAIGVNVFDLRLCNAKLGLRDLYDRRQSEVIAPLRQFQRKPCLAQQLNRYRNALVGIRSRQPRGANVMPHLLLKIAEAPVGRGKSNRDIADLLHISVTTAESHRSSILQKLHLHSLAELILYAVRKGLICT